MIAALAGQRGEVLRSLKPKLVASALVLTELGCSRNEAGSVRATSTSAVALSASAPTTSGAGGSLTTVAAQLQPESTSEIPAGKTSAIVAPGAVTSSVLVEPQSVRVVKESDVPDLGSALRVWLEHQELSVELLRPRKPAAIALGTMREVTVVTRHLLVVPFRWEDAYCGVAIVDRARLSGPYFLPPRWGGIGPLWDCRWQMKLKSTLDLNGDSIPDFFFVTDFFTHQHDEYITLTMAFLSDVGRQTFCYEDELSRALHVQDAAKLTPKHIQELARREIDRLAKLGRSAGTCSNEVFRRYPP